MSFSMTCKTPGCERSAGRVVGYCVPCQERMRRRLDRGAPATGEPPPRGSHLSEEQLEVLWRRRAAFWSYRAIARELGVSVTAVARQVRKGRG